MKRNELYDVGAELERELGPAGSAEWKKNVSKAWDEYNAQVLLDARKGAKMTQSEVADKIGATKSYISRVEHGQIVPTASSFYRIIKACGLQVQITYPSGRSL